MSQQKKKTVLQQKQKRCMPTEEKNKDVCIMNIKIVNVESMLNSNANVTQVKK